MKICLDPGHTKGYNIGVNKNYREGTAMHALAVKLKAALEQYEGVEVVVTRTLTENPTLDERAKFARNNRCDVLLSLHTNAASNKSACGVTVFYSVKRASKDLADDLAHAIAKTMNTDTDITYSRGAKTRTYIGNSDGKTYDYYGVIRTAVIGNAVSHALIVEHGFHTNALECQWLLQDKNLDKLAQTDAQVLAEYFGLEKQKPKKPNAATKPVAIQKGDKVCIREAARTYGNSAIKIPAWVKKEVHTVAAIGTTANRRNGQARLLEINSWVSLADLTPVTADSWLPEEGDAVRVKGTDKWVSGVKMASWVTKGTVFYVHSTRETGAVTVIGKKVAGGIAVTGAVYTKYLEKV